MVTIFKKGERNRTLCSKLHLLQQASFKIGTAPTFHVRIISWDELGENF